MTVRLGVSVSAEIQTRRPLSNAQNTSDQLRKRFETGLGGEYFADMRRKITQPRQA